MVSADRQNGDVMIRKKTVKLTLFAIAPVHQWLEMPMTGFNARLKPLSKTQEE